MRPNPTAGLAVWLAVALLVTALASVLGEDACEDALTIPDWNDDPSVPLTPVAARDKPFEPCQQEEYEPRCIERDVALLDFSKSKLARAPDEVFVAVNGASKGGVFKVKDLGCLRTLAAKALDLLADPHVERLGPKYLYSSGGLPVRNKEEVIARAGRELYVLNSQQTWVWPAHAINLTFPVHGNVRLKTVSVVPRVFTVENLLTSEECDAIITKYDGELERSPEKHYSDEFKDHRTSETGWMSDHPVRRVMQRILRLPELNHVESLQFLKYGPGQRYRFHHDYFHDYRRKYLQSLRRWMKMRVIELVEVEEPVDEPAQNVLRSSLARSEDGNWQVKNPPQAVILDWIMRLSRSHLPATAIQLFQQELNLDSEARIEKVLRRPRSAGLVAASSVLAKGIGLELDNASEDTFIGCLVFNTLMNDPRIDTEPFETTVQPNRHATILPYLSDVAEGGETALPRADNPKAFLGEGFQYPKHDLPECSKGLVLSPKKGSASLFYHRDPSGDLEPKSEHAGCPPKLGVKYAINGFTWNVPPDWGIRFFVK